MSRENKLRARLNEVLAPAEVQSLRLEYGVTPSFSAHLVFPSEAEDLEERARCYTSRGFEVQVHSGRRSMNVSLPLLKNVTWKMQRRRILRLMV